MIVLADQVRIMKLAIFLAANGFERYRYQLEKIPRRPTDTFRKSYKPVSHFTLARILLGVSDRPRVITT